MKTENFPHLAAFIQQSSKKLHVTRDELVRATGMCSDKASAVWNGKDIRLSYYLAALKLLLKRSENPRYKLSSEQLLESFKQAITQDLSG